jgi:plasmid stabilization system protein ParE
MPCKVIWSERAADDLFNIASYVELDDAAVAVRIGNAICDHVDRLMDFPEIAPVYAETAFGRVRALVHNPYRIYYQFNAQDKVVEVLRVRHSARKPLTGSDFV